MYKSEMDDQKALQGLMAIERNLLGVPTFVLHAQTAKAMEEIRYEWSAENGDRAIFLFSRHRDCGFPLPIHTVYLDILLALFSANFRDDGWLRFRFSDLMRIAGKDVRLGGDSLRAAKEAIRRYYLCSAEWRLAWKGKERGWRGPIITSEDVWELGRKGSTKRNPRRSKNPDDWHSIQFHSFVVDSIKNGYQRLLLSEICREVSPAAFCVYRYFYGFSDRSPVTRSLEQLTAAFPWRGRRDRFVKWLGQQLEELAKMGYVGRYEIGTTSASVRCRSIAEIKGYAPPRSLFGD